MSRPTKVAVSSAAADADADDHNNEFEDDENYSDSDMSSSNVRTLEDIFESIKRIKSLDNGFIVRKALNSAKSFYHFQ